MRFFKYSKNNVYKKDVFFEKIFSKNYSEFYLLKSLRLTGFEEIKKKKKIKGVLSSDESLRCSLSRTKKSIRDLALSNNFDFFYTQTFSSSYRYNFEIVVDVFKRFCKAFHRICPTFKYLVIYEKHKDGAIHLHGLLKGISSSYLRKNEYGYLTFTYFETLGFNSLSKIRDNLKCSNYITKYISKDFLRTSKGQIYFCSKNLDRPKKIIYDNYELNNYQFVFGNDFVKKYIRRSKNDKGC